MKDKPEAIEAYCRRERILTRERIQERACSLAGSGKSIDLQIQGGGE